MILYSLAYKLANTRGIVVTLNSQGSVWCWHRSESVCVLGPTLALNGEARLLHHKVLAVRIQLAELRHGSLVGWFVFVDIFCLGLASTELLELRGTLIRLSKALCRRRPIENMGVLFLQLLKHFWAVLRLH